MKKDNIYPLMYIYNSVSKAKGLYISICTLLYRWGKDLTKEANKMRYPKSIQNICARCGKKWSPTCCDYSYKAVKGAMMDCKTIPESNRLIDLLEKCKGVA